MSDEIMREQAEMMQRFRAEFPNAITLEDTMRQMLALKADRDLWKNTCVRMTSLMLPLSLLLSKQEQEELQTILREAVRGE